MESAATCATAAPRAACGGRPGYFPSYYCTGGRAVWAYRTNTQLGVHETEPDWTVRTAPVDGQERLYLHHVAKVYYVGTATG